MLIRTEEKETTTTKIPIKDLAGSDGECLYEKPRDDELLVSINVLATWMADSLQLMLKYSV